MSKRRATTVVMAIIGAVIVNGTLPSAAGASEARGGISEQTSTHSSVITPELITEAIAEARSAGAIQREQTNSDGTRSVTIAGDGGVALELNEPTGRERLSAGSDSYGGLYVGFNAHDQGLIISGGIAAVAAGLCALGPAVRVVANVVAVIASNAITSSGGVRCGSKSLRVYPITQKSPRCA